MASGMRAGGGRRPPEPFFFRSWTSPRRFVPELSKSNFSSLSFAGCTKFASRDMREGSSLDFPGRGSSIRRGLCGLSNFILEQSFSALLISLGFDSGLRRSASTFSWDCFVSLSNMPKRLFCLCFSPSIFSELTLPEFTSNLSSEKPSVFT